MDRFDIHNREKRFENRLEDIKTNERISEEDKKVILKFKDECLSNNLSIDRVLFYLTKLKQLALRFNKNFRKLDKKDIKDFVKRLNKGEIKKKDAGGNETDEEYSAWGKQAYKLTLKKLFQVMESYEWKSNRYPEGVRWIKTTVKKNNKKIPEELFTKGDIKKLVSSVSKVRDKAFIMVLYESGTRIGEILSLRLKDVSFTKHGVNVTVNGKTGSRKILLVSSEPYLSNWLDQHPRKGEKEAPLWVSLATNCKGEPLEYKGAYKLLQKAKEKAGIEKPANPHHFRHSRATHLANKLTEAQMCEYFGWKQGSDMPSTYVHLSQRDMKDAILGIHGIKKEEEEERKEIKTIKCPRCGKKNPETREYCRNCRAPLTEEAKQKATKEDQGFFNEVLTPRTVEKMIENKVQSIKENRQEKIKQMEKKILKKIEASS